MIRPRALFFSTVSATAMALSGPAFAQQTEAQEDPAATLQTEQEIESGEDMPDCDALAPGAPIPPECVTPAEADTGAIIVTGTRLRTPNLSSPVPVTSVGGEEIFQSGNVSVGDQLAELPSIASTFTQANSTRFLGTAGLNILDLRGLGTARTLVLVNGRRHVGGDVLSSGVSVDVNTIPADMIERIDVVTGGNSAVYGSDAISGVVNFILKDNFDGIQLRGQGGISKYGDAGSYFVSGIVGRNFADGRANVTFNAEYARRDNAWGDDRDWLYKVLATVDSDIGVSSDGVPDRILNPDFRSVTFSALGTVLFGTTPTYNCGISPGNQTPYSCPFIFQPDGTLVPLTGVRIGTGPNGQMIGGNGEDFVSGHQIQITPEIDRINLNLTGHYEISPAFEPFVEAKYSRTHAVGTGASGPAFLSSGGSVGVLGDLFAFAGGRNRERIRLDNPFLTQQARDTICQQQALQGLPACTDSTTFAINKVLIGLTPRIDELERDTYRIVGGVRGEIGSSWNYEIALNYGRLDEENTIQGNLDTQRMLLAMDAVRDPNTGEIVCRSQIDPNAAFGGTTYFYNYFYGENASPFDPNFEARLAADIAACVPVNVLGATFTPAQANYLLLDTVAKGRTEQFNAVGYISGDTSGFFELPGGPIGIVLGAEYRADDLFYHQDEQITLGYTFYNPIPTFDAPKSKVKEAFGEIRLPLLRDQPFFNELEVSGAARVSDYTLGTTGTVWAYNGNVMWSPIEDLRLRGNYARSVRAPNQVELFSPFGQNFALVADPCDADNIATGSSTRAANCLAAGVPAGTQINYSSSLPFLTGGNIDLAEESSDSITIGGVFTPRFLPGFSFSADYYDIEIDDAIQFLSAQFVLNACYDAATLDNPFCDFFQRAGPGQIGHSSQPFGILPNSLRVTPFNFASLRARGLDFEVAYRNQIANVGRLDAKLIWTHALELTTFTNPEDPDDANRILSELGNPKDAANLNLALQTGPVTLGYQARYIGRMVTNTYEDFFEFDGNPPENPDFADEHFYPSRFYHDARVAFDVGDRFNFYVGVDNFTNEKPPYGLSGIGGGSAIYDAIGRFYYAGVVAKF